MLDWVHGPLEDAVGFPTCRKKYHSTGGDLFLISQLFSFYIDYAARNVTSNNTIGVFISLMIWLYFNCLAVMVGAYVNLIWYKYRQRTNELGKIR